MTIDLKNEGNILCLIGESNNHLGNSHYLSIIQNKEDGGTPSVNLDDELKNGKFILDCVAKKLLKSVHDVGEGGVLVAIAEMCISGKQGIKIDITKDFLHGFFFGEDQARYLVEVSQNKLEQLEVDASKSAVKIERIGEIGGTSISINSIGEVELSSLIDHHTKWFNEF